MDAVINRGTRVGAMAPAAALVVLSLCASGPSRGDDWPAWRGPQGTGVSTDRDFPWTWGERENVRWRAPLPDRGNSTPIVWGDRVFVTQAVEREDRRTVMCLDRATGKRRWQAGVTFAAYEPTNGQNPYCAASPATDGRHVVAYFGSAGLFCYDLDGRELWRRDVGRVDSWQGSGSSPVIHGGLCFLNAGPGTEAALLACDVETGDVVWRVTPPLTPAKPPGAVAGGAASRPAAAPRDKGFDGAMMSADPAGAGGFLGSWSTPLARRSGDRDELVVVHALEVTAYDPRTGKARWTCKGLPEQAFASPVVGEGVLIATGHVLEGGGTRVTALRLDASMAGDVTATHRLWQAHLPKDCVGTGAVANGHLFLVTQFGTAVCLDLRDGRKVWEKRLSGEGAFGGSWSSFVLAGDRLLVPNHTGEVFVLRASPTFEVLATNLAAEEPTCASLAVAGGQVFLRTHKALWCFAREAR